MDEVTSPSPADEPPPDAAADRTATDGEKSVEKPQSSTEVPPSEDSSKDSSKNSSKVASKDTSTSKDESASSKPPVETGTEPKKSKLIRFACECGKKFEVDSSNVGKETTCPSCQAPLTVPATSTIISRRKREKMATVAAAKAKLQQAAREKEPKDFKEQIAARVDEVKTNPYQSGIAGFIGGFATALLLLIPIIIWIRSAKEPVIVQAAPKSQPTLEVQPRIPRSDLSEGPSFSLDEAALAADLARRKVEAENKKKAEAEAAAAANAPQDPMAWENANFARLQFTITKETAGSISGSRFPQRDFPSRFEENDKAKEEAIAANMSAEQVAMRFELGAYFETPEQIEVVIFLFPDQFSSWPIDGQRLDWSVWDVRRTTDEKTGASRQVLFDLGLEGTSEVDGKITGELSGRLLFLGVGEFTFTKTPFALSAYKFEDAQ